MVLKVVSITANYIGRFGVSRFDFRLSSIPFSALIGPFFLFDAIYESLTEEGGVFAAFSPTAVTSPRGGRFSRFIRL